MVSVRISHGGRRRRRRRVLDACGLSSYLVEVIDGGAKRAAILDGEHDDVGGHRRRLTAHLLSGNIYITRCSQSRHYN